MASEFRPRSASRTAGIRSRLTRSRVCGAGECVPEQLRDVRDGGLRGPGAGPLRAHLGGRLAGEPPPLARIQAL
eukprot:5916047-Pyramimonas_sp.AAC.2